MLGKRNQTVGDDSKATYYPSDIILGQRYRDRQTGIEGIATTIAFHQHACERVMIEFINQKDGKLEELMFDAPRLINVETGKQSTSEKTGGPDHGVTGGRDAAMRR